jgi:hypothetical protein
MSSSSSSSSSKPLLSGSERAKLSRQNQIMNETPEDRTIRLKNLADKAKIRRENQQPEQRSLSLENAKLCHQNRILNESPEDKTIRLQNSADKVRIKRESQQPEQRDSTLKNNAEQHRLQRRRELAEQREVRLSNAAALNTSIRLNALEIREKEIAARGFIENWMLDAKDSNPYYKHALFPESHNKHDWPKAIKGSWQFGYRRTRGYVSLEFFWNKECGNCGATYLNGSSKNFSMKCCKDSLYDGKCPLLQPLINDYCIMT